MFNSSLINNLTIRDITPDYNAGVSITPYNTEYIAEADGIIAGELSAASNGYMAIYINGIVVEQIGSEQSQRCRSTFYAQIMKGDIIKIECAGNYQTPLANFFPYR